MKTMISCWSYLCDVDIAPLAAWLAEGDKGWPAPSTPCKPQRIREIPAELLGPIFRKILGRFPPRFENGESRCGANATDPMLSRMFPGQSHDFHIDRQRADWITRVHVPITTNPHCWMAWEDSAKLQHWLHHCDTLPNVRDIAEVVHFEAGKAYSFNTLERHAFGNDGETERVHLIFDVLRKDT